MNQEHAFPGYATTDPQSTHTLGPDPATAAEQAELLVRAEVALTLAEWARLTPLERVLVARARERRALAFAAAVGEALRDPAAVRAGADGGASFVRGRLEQAAAAALAGVGP